MIEWGCNIRGPVTILQVLNKNFSLACEIKMTKEAEVVSVVLFFFEAGSHLAQAGIRLAV